MAQELTNNLLNDLLDNGLPANLFMSAHTATPNLTGASEVTGGTYARVTATYSAASTGIAALSSTVTLNIPAGRTVTHLGLWSHVTSTSAAHFRAQEDIADQAFAGAGTLAVTALPIDLTNHPA